MVGVAVHVIAATNSHTIENIVELHSQLGIHSLAKEEFLHNRQRFAAFKRIAEARVEWSGVPDSPSPGKLKLFEVEYRHTLVISCPSSHRKNRA